MDERNKAKEQVAKLEQDNGLIMERNLELEDQVKKLQEGLAAQNLATD